MLSVDGKERVNEVFKNLLAKYVQQAGVERGGQTPQWPLYERAKQLFGPIIPRQVAEASE